MFFVVLFKKKVARSPYLSYKCNMWLPVVVLGRNIAQGQLYEWKHQNSEVTIFCPALEILMGADAMLQRASIVSWPFAAVIHHGGSGIPRHAGMAVVFKQLLDATQHLLSCSRAACVYSCPCVECLSRSRQAVEGESQCARSRGRCGLFSVRATV